MTLTVDDQADIHAAECRDSVRAEMDRLDGLSRDEKDMRDAFRLADILRVRCFSEAKPLTQAEATGILGRGNHRDLHGGCLGRLDAICEARGWPRLRSLIVQAVDGLPARRSKDDPRFWMGEDLTPADIWAMQQECYRYFNHVPSADPRVRARKR